MSAACGDAGLPPPEFSAIGLRFRLTLRTAPVTLPASDPREAVVLAFLDRRRGRSTAEVAAHIGLTSRATQQRLARLADRGLAVAVGSGPKDPRRRWLRGPGGR